MGMGKPGYRPYVCGMARDRGLTCYLCVGSVVLVIAGVPIDEQVISLHAFITGAIANVTIY